MLIVLLIFYMQVKAFLRKDSPPFSAGQLEGIASMTNANVRIAKKLSSDSLRYWLLEFLRQQPKGRKYRALVLRFIKDRLAALLLMEVNYMSLSCFRITICTLFLGRSDARTQYILLFIDRIRCLVSRLPWNYLFGSKLELSRLKGFGARTCVEV